MNKLKTYDMTGNVSGDVELSDDLLVLGSGEQAVHDCVVAIRNAGRQGSASTLHKGEVAGSNKKPWRQKGTGRARAGYRQSPIWRGGAAAFGPKPRSYAVKVNRKVGRLAFRRAFSEKLMAEQIKVLDELTLADAKTKAFTSLLKTLEVSAPALIVVDQLDRNLALAARNIPGIAVARAQDINVYELLRYPQVVVTKAGLDVVKQRLDNGKGAASE
jgi:large subunit ribosomal protein L4